MTGNPRLSARARGAIEEAGRNAYVSAATAWELCTKVRLGKWPEAEVAASQIALTISALDLTALPISIEHGRLAGTMSGPHKDSFDRILAAQAELEGLVLVTADSAFRTFAIATLW